MYQFTTTNVINTQYAKDYEGNDLLNNSGTQIAAVTGTSAGLKVTKVGDFKKANIVSIYKRPYQAAVKEIAKVTIPQIASGLVARLEIVLNLSQSTQSDFVNYALEFKKPIVVEVIATNSAATDAAALIVQLNALKTRFGIKYFTAAISTADVVITCSDPSIRVKSMIISKEVASPTSTVSPAYEDVSSTTFSVTTPGKIGFGDDNWMTRNIVLQTAENVRYFGISKNERPIMGGNYSQYTLRYSVAKDGNDGTLAGATSVTTHVFYVISTEVTRFESAIASVGLTVPATLQITAADLSLSTGSNQTDQITWTGGVGAVTFATADDTIALVGATTGLVTTAGITGTGTVVITATDAVGGTDTLTYTVS